MFEIQKKKIGITLLVFIIAMIILLNNGERIFAEGATNETSNENQYTDLYRADLGTTTYDGITLWYYETWDGTIYASADKPNGDSSNTSGEMTLFSVDYPYTEDEGTPVRTYGNYPVKSSLKTLDGRAAFCLDPNRSSPNPDELAYYIEQVKNDPVFYGILAYGYGGAQDIFTSADGDTYDQYYATIMALVRYIGNTNAWEGLDYPYQAFDYCPAAQKLLSYAQAHPVDTSYYKLMYILPGEGAPRNTQSLVALSGPLKGSLQIGKKDANSGVMVPGAQFKVDGETLVTTGADGTVTIPGLTPGNHTVQEVNVPEPYVLDGTVETISVTAGQTASYIKANIRQTFTITLQKQDDTLGSTPQADATFAGAVFQIKDASGQVADLLTTGSNGKTQPSKALELGQYTVTEIKAPTGYVLNSKPVTVTGTYQGQNITQYNVVQVMLDTVIKGNVSILKFAVPDYEDAQTDIDGNLKGLKGAEFTLSLNSDPQNALYHFTGTTDDTGALTLKDVPYGTYTLTETKTPAGFKTIDPIQNVIVHEQGKTYNYYLANYPMASEVRIKKLDAEDDKTVALAGTVFKIIDRKTNTFVSEQVGLEQKTQWTTNASGTLMLDKALAAGDYALVEMGTPVGYHQYQGAAAYTVEGKTYKGVPFVVSEGTSTIESTGGKSYFVTEVDLKNAPIKGRIQIEKSGEVVTGTRTEMVENQEVTRFVYQTQALSNVTFDVVASEDIEGASYVDPDRLLQAIQDLPDPFNANYSLLIKKWQSEYLSKRIYFKAGEIVETITTDNNGIAITDPLPIGNYKVVEKSVPEGYVLDRTEYHVEVKDNGEIADLQNVADLQISNTRQKGCFILDKLEEQFKEYEQVGDELHVITTNQKADDILFGIYTAQDMVIGRQSFEPRFMEVSGITSIPKDTLVDCVWAKDGVVQSTTDLPIGKYYYKEIKTKDQLLLDDTKYPMQWGYDANAGEVITVYANEGKDVINRMRPIPFELDKTDVSSGEPIPGAKIRIYDQNKKVIFEGSTDQDGKIKLNALVPGSYYYQEYEAPKGYELNEDLFPFEVTAQDQIVKCQMTNKKLGGVDIEKTDAVTGKALPNTGIRIYDKDQNIVREGKTDASGHLRFEDLKEGDYYFQEYDAPEGYQINENLNPFRVESGKITQCVMTNQQIPDTGLNSMDNGTFTAFVLLGIAGVIGLAYFKERKHI